MTINENDFILVKSKKYDKNKLIEILNFDKQGKLLPKHKPQERLLSDREKPEKKEVFDNSGKLIEVTYLRNKKFSCSHQYEYDNRGNEIKDTFVQSEPDYEQQILSYYNDNNKITKIEFFDDKVFSGDAFYEWDTNGNNIVLIAHDSNGRVRYKHFNTFDNNKLVEQKYFGGNGHLCWTQFCKYNKDGYVIEKNTHDCKMLFHRIITVYDENNNRIQSQTWIHKDYIKKWYAGKYLRYPWR